MVIASSDIVKLKSKFPAATQEVNRLLVKSLSPTQRKIYLLFGDDTFLGSRDFAVTHGMIQTTAAEALRELHGMGLLGRKKIKQARKYLYWRQG